MEEVLKQFMELMNNKFEIMDKRFDQMDKRFENMESRFNKRFDEIDKRFDKIESDIKVIKDDVTIIKETTNNNLTESRSHFLYIENKLDEQSNMFKFIGKEFKKVNIDIDYLIEKTGKHDAEINNINKRIQL